MFTGIIESMGVIEDITISGSNKTFRLKSSITTQLQVDESLSHNGVCLTVENIQDDIYQVTAIAETLSKTALGELKPGDLVNLERAMVMNGRLDGHIVQGHVDHTATCTAIVEKNGSSEYSFETSPVFNHLMIEKGSITLNGISLTIFNVNENHFTVGVIPYTLKHTNLHTLKVNELVNIEFDVIGKYVEKMMRKFQH